jgi:hypothetical protein
MATIYLREFPEDLHHKAKIQAVTEKLTLRDLFAKALRWYLMEAGVLDMMGDEEEEGASMLVSRQDIIELFGTDDISEIKWMVKERAKLIAKAKKALKSGTLDGAETGQTKEGNPGNPETLQHLAD